MNKLPLVLILLLVTSLIVVVASQTVSAETTSSPIIRIKPDGTVEGTDKIVQTGNVYTLTSSLVSVVHTQEAFIFVQKDNIILDGQGFSLQGSGFGTAIYMLRVQNVTIENFNIYGFETGINFWTVKNWPSDSIYLELSSASNNQIVNNNIVSSGAVSQGGSAEAGWCIYLRDAVGNTVSNNTLTAMDHKGGMYLDQSTSNTILLNNKFIRCSIFASSSNQTSAVGNTVDGKPLVYLEDESNQVIDAAGLVYLFNCNNITVENVQPMFDYGKTIQLTGTVNSEVLNCRGYITLLNSNQNMIHDNFPIKIALFGSSHNRIFANSITDSGVCIELAGASNYNEVFSNILSNSSSSLMADKVHQAGLNTAGVQLGNPNLGGSQYNSIHDNIMANDDCGLEFYLSSNNNIFSNTIANCKAGVQLGASNQNNITQNNITSCQYGISIYAASSSNNFYHNNFIGNSMHVYESHLSTLLSNTNTYSVNNTWDNGYPSGGNYWSNYTGKDNNEDGIGDVQYTVFEGMIDYYPLMQPFSVSAPSNDGSIVVPINQKPTVAYQTPPNGDKTVTQTPEPFPYIWVTLAIIVACTVIVGLYLKKRMF